jgi:prepilin-type N-terminal cleavage/methylation domain-containing protein
MTPKRLRSEQGVTLIEMLVAMTILSILVGVAFAFMRQQSEAVLRGSNQMRVLQNGRFALSMLEKDLRTAGVGIAAGQPFLVYADSQTIAFNADFVTRDVNERLSAVYVDSTAQPGGVSAATRAERFRIPGTEIWYPDTSYQSGAGNSPAETVIFFFSRDTSTARSDDYALYRQVNGLAPVPVARDLLKPAGLPFLRYHRRVAPPGQAERLDSIPASRLLHHSASMHPSPRDTGRAALVDSIRAVEINLRATSGEAGVFEQLETVKRLVQLPNVGVSRLVTCGARPALGGSLSAAGGLVGGVPAVTLTWPSASDERGGERDVLRYVIWRKRSAADPWGDPYTSLPVSGATSYRFDDTGVDPSTSYLYALAAQDCTPSLSGLITASGTSPAAP